MKNALHKPTLSAVSLRKSYGKKTVLDGLSLSVHPGEIVGLLGPNGAGKTTCFYLLAGLLQPDAGCIYFNGQDITTLPLHHRAKLGVSYLPQDASVFRYLTVSNNIMAILELSMRCPQARQRRCDALLAMYRITNIKDRYGYQLSGGERRRVEIARAVCLSPQLLFLDEPFAGVDPVSIGELQDIIKQLANEGMGILMTDHNVRETLRLCHRAYIVYGGRVLAEGHAASLLKNPTVRDVYLGQKFE